MFNPRFLVISLGNPLPKYSSLHSAGHFALNGLARVLHQPSFREARLADSLPCLLSEGPKYTLVQSPVLMNTSGSFVASAWRAMSTEHDPTSLGLVLVHDELEKELGVVTLVPWQRSAYGHRGIKDAKLRLQQHSYPASPFARISVGIGRPLERDNETVVKYVMKKISNEERRAIEGDGALEVAQKLVDLESRWSAEVQAQRRDPGLGWAERPQERGARNR